MDPSEAPQQMMGSPAPMPGAPPPGAPPPSNTPCRFSFGCRRPNCYFAHPDGRQIDSGGPGGPPMAQPMMPGGFVPRSGPPPTGPGGMHAFPPMGAVCPPCPPMSGGGGGKRVCRFGHGCTRADCYFAHPDGRSIDGGKAPAGGMGNTGGRGGRGSPMGGRGFRPPQPSNKETEEMIKRDTWYPQARNCTCCKGFIFGCKTEACEASGQGCGSCHAPPADASNAATPAEGEAKKDDKPAEAVETKEGAEAVDTLSGATADLKVSE